MLAMLLQETIDTPAPRTAFLTNRVESVRSIADHGKALAIERGPGVLAALLLLIAAWVLSSWLRRVIIKGLVRAHVDITVAKFFANLSRWGVLMFAVVTSLGTLGMNTTSLAAVIGAAGIAVGLALQGSLSNLASGVLLLVFRPFKVGDAVIVAGQSGIVDGIDLFTTNLDTADNRRIVIPNGAIFNGIIENQTRHPTRRVVVNVPVSGDIARAQAALLGAAHRALKAGGAHTHLPPGCVLAEIAPAVVFSVSLWCDTGEYAGVKETLMREIRATLEAEAMLPGPPTSNLHVLSLPAPKL